MSDFGFATGHFSLLLLLTYCLLPLPGFLKNKFFVYLSTDLLIWLDRYEFDDVSNLGWQKAVLVLGIAFNGAVHWYLLTLTCLYFEIWIIVCCAFVFILFILCILITLHLLNLFLQLRYLLIFLLEFNHHLLLVFLFFIFYLLLLFGELGIQLFDALFKSLTIFCFGFVYLCQFV